jgi:tRNA threonylcarbamoyl adenosine modification protein (Sua5/YciO/YrdC/YwlC family)
MAKLVLSIHSKTPELRKIDKVVEALNEGSVILYPTDTGFSLGCTLSNKEAIQRIRAIRGLPDGKAMTFLCNSLSNIAEFARVTNLAYRTIKRLIPGPYTFILPASKLVPKFAQDPKRKTAGLRVPDQALPLLLLKQLESPLISISAKKPFGEPFKDNEELIEYYANLVDVAVRSDEYSFSGESTVIDMTSDDFTIMREGAGYEKVMELMEIEEEMV